MFWFNLKNNKEIQDFRSAIIDLKLANKIDPDDISIKNEISRITDEYLKIWDRNVQKSFGSVDELIDDENENNKNNVLLPEIIESNNKNMEKFICSITENKKNKNQEKIKIQNSNFENMLNKTNEKNFINENEQEWSDLEEEIDKNSNDSRVPFEINLNAIIPDEIQELGRFFGKKMSLTEKIL